MLALGLLVCIAMVAAVGITILLLDAWGNRHAEWTDKQVRRVSR